MSDPPDGKVPALTAEAQQRNAARARERAARGPADSPEDRSLYDRCITRGIPGSMMPAIYGNAYEIVQGPGYVVITYEMVHEARVIPLTPAPHAGDSIRMYMGDAKRPLGGQHARRRDDELHGQDRLSWLERASQADGTLHADRAGHASNGRRPSTTPHTWATPWTFAMNLSRKDDSQRPFEYACHEGNYAMFHLLLAARADGRQGGRGDAKKGIVRTRTADGADEQER